MLDDAVDHGKAEPGTLRSFGAEERFEDAALGFGVHSYPGVADGEHYIFARLGRRMRASIAFVERDIRSFNGELAAARHRIAGIDRQVHDDLLDLARISLGRAQVGSRHHHQFDILADQAGKHSEVFRDHRIQIENLGG